MVHVSICSSEAESFCLSVWRVLLCLFSCSWRAFISAEPPLSAFSSSEASNCSSIGWRLSFNSTSISAFRVSTSLLSDATLEYCCCRSLTVLARFSSCDSSVAVKAFLNSVAFSASYAFCWSLKAFTFAASSASCLCLASRLSFLFRSRSTFVFSSCRRSPY